MVPATANPASTADYRRSARRLRARFSHHPPTLHRALQDLADTHDRTTSSAPTTSRTIHPLRTVRSFHGISPDPITAAIERAFADHVAEHLDGLVLCYSERLTMLKAAERLRINRFRANLIIALMQHEFVRESAGHSLITNDTATSRRWWPMLRPVALAVFCEIAILAGVMCILHPW